MSENDDFLSEVTFRSVSFGGRMGHSSSLRDVAIEKLGVKKVAQMIDSDIEQYFIEMGFVPVKINGYSDENESLYLVKKSVLKSAIILKR